MNHIIDILVFILLSLAGLVMAVIAMADSFLAAAMTYAGLAPIFQIMVLILIALWLTILSVRIMGPLLSTLITALLILLVVHRLFPTFQPPAPPQHDMSVIQSYI